MSAPPAVETHDLVLEYRLDRNRAGTFKEYAIHLFRGQVERDTLRALDRVTFEVAPGEIFGVIGPNGAGKSTLMKLIARVLPPTEGRVIVRGNVAAMISLGAGFNPELTARENVVLYGTLLGRETRLMRERVDAVIGWAELEDFVDVPVRSFSTGMLARLGFAVATDTNADVVIVDEVLSVGDEAFRRKSLRRMEELIGGGTAVVLVSHAMNTVQKLCERVMWLERGRVQMLGDPDEVVGAYQQAADERDVS